MRVSIATTPAHVAIGQVSRYETNAPHADVRLRHETETVHGSDAHIPAPYKHAPRFGERAIGIATMFDRPDRHDASERAARKREVFRVAANEIDLDPSQLRTAACNDEPPK